MDTITLILIIGLAAQGLAFAALILAGPVYAWNDLAGPLYAWNGDSPLGEEQSTTERRAPIAGLTVLTALPPTRTGSNPFFRSFLKISFCCQLDSCPAEILYSSSG